MNHHTLRALALGILLPLAAVAQSDAPQSPSAPAIAAPAPVESKPSVEVAPSPTATQTPTPTPTPAPTASPTPTPQPAVAPPSPEGKPAKGEIRLNFQNASLADVLSYLSEAVGFIIIQEAPVTGTVNIVSKQPVSADEAVDLLNSVLAEKGYAAIRNGRVLKIVNRRDAQKQDIPVMSGSDPTQIPRKDGIVTQILPVRYVDAAKLVENLRPLLSPDATLSANEASNAILLADTQTNIHRIAEIVHALDTSVASISAIRVFSLQYADSKSLANVLTQLFATDQAAKGNTTGAGRGNGPTLPPWAAAFMGGRGGAGASGGNGGSGQSAAQQAASRVVAVADDQSNSVIVSAPEAAMVTIADIVRRVDTNIADITETRIFPLTFADATELATVLNSLYSDKSGTPAKGASGNQRAQAQPAAANPNTANRSERSLLQSRIVAVPDVRTNSVIVSAARESMIQIALTVERLDSNVADNNITETRIFRLAHADCSEVVNVLNTLYSDPTAVPKNGKQNPSAAASAANRSDRALLLSRVVSVPDPRTNSVLISAAREQMPQIAMTVDRLDSSESKKQKVYIYSLENADPDNVATILRGMFGTQSSATNTSAQPSSNQLNKRSSTGASSNISNVLNTSGNSNSRSR